MVRGNVGGWVYLVSSTYFRMTKLEMAVPRCYFLPTSPGSKFVTLGGAVANDVHGKNHHRAGSFGNHVTRFGLVRSDMGELEVSADSHPEIFAATIGGLGLTGLITWVEVQLTTVSSSNVQEQTKVFNNIEEFFEVEKANRELFEHFPFFLVISCASSPC